MFSRIRGAIDRTIAEEQARQKDQTSQGVSRSGSTSSRTSASGAKRPKPKSASNDASKADDAPNPDPAVFEAAFVIDDSDDPSRAGTPKPQTSEAGGNGLDSVKDDGEEEKAAEGADGKAQDDSEKKEGEKDESAKAQSKAADTAAAPSTELPPDIKQKLRKLEKLEATYPELLRSYRVAHRRATAIEPFERALRENTPLTSIGDPNALTEYLNQLNLRSDMVMQELKRVSAENDELKKSHEQDEEKIKKLEADLEAAKGGKPVEETGEPQVEAPRQSVDDKAVAPEKVRSPVLSVMGMFSPKQKAAQQEATKGDGDLFSYDEELPQLQADLASRDEEIQTLRKEVDGLKGELSVAKESSTELANNLEKVEKELTGSKDAASSRESLQKELEARNSEIARLNERLEASQSQIKALEADLASETKALSAKVKEVEASLATQTKQVADSEAEVTKANQAKTVTKKLIDDLNTQIKSLEKEKTESERKITELAKKLESQPETASKPVEPAAASKPAALAAPAAGGGNSKKKNKKKKGKGGAVAGGQQAEEVSEAPEPAAAAAEAVDSGALEAEIAKLKDDVSEKDAQIERLSKQRKTEEDLSEEIESLRDDLLNIGQDHVQAKEKIKTLEAEKAELKGEIADLEKKMSTSAASDVKANQHKEEMEKLQREYDDLKEKSSTLQSDLGAAQQLAQTRFKDLSDLREVLQKAQPELKTLRQESATLKTTKEELATKSKELKDAEKKEKDLKRDLTRAQQQASERETEVQSLQQKLTAEGTAKARLEDEKRAAGRDLRKVEGEKAELATRAEAAEKELAKVQEEVNQLRPRVKELEEQMHKLRREKTAAQEEVDFKTQQYSNAQGLLSSMRDQTTEMSVQLKESKSQSEALEEELAEVQRLLQERSREGETMRRLLADVDERADAKVRDMRSRMESAIEERDRIEDESSTLARRKARETEELKGKIREMEREVKTLTREREELEEREKEWRRRREELESVEEKAEAETAEMRSTVTQLRSALDASESQVRDAEKQRTELRKLLDEARQRYERTHKELKGTQARLMAGAGSSRSSIDSSRSGLTANGGGNSSPGGADLMYLKTILLQFLEQKDGKLRAQLVPVLGKLLKFDKTDEAKWQSAVQHIEGDLSKIRQPRVIAEVVGGIILGPSVMGRIPGFQDSIFPPDSIPGLTLVANLGLVLYLFLIGLETDVRFLINNWRVASAVAFAGLALPFALGSVLALGLYNQFRDEPGVANDVIGWILVALCVTLANSGNGLSSPWILLACLGHLLFLLYDVQPALRGLLRRTGNIDNGPSRSMIALIILIALASAFFTAIIGGFAIKATEKLEDLIGALILSTRTFTIFVVMTLLTTFATTPLVTYLYSPWYQKKLAAWKRGEISWDDSSTAQDGKSVAQQNLPASNHVGQVPVYLRLDTMPSLLSLVSLFGMTADSAGGTGLNEKSPHHTPPVVCPVRAHGLRLIQLGDRDSSVMSVSDVDEYTKSDTVVNTWRTVGPILKVVVSGEPADARAYSFNDIHRKIQPIPVKHHAQRIVFQFSPRNDAAEELVVSAMGPLCEDSGDVSYNNLIVLGRHGSSGKLSRGGKYTVSASPALVECLGDADTVY
ncbi:Golgin-like protein [Emericellopsis cladophorae]|uniref:Golgin-like protein n=1 Tax=Emericellopsis cladophorae TaxID=2686198 RepID=A0A9Q0BD69_9HYPO|nr:Golgin-like protein [Emericellopsis cladophorae]KAI6780516.1 Golgin-like protein [Emericellopsis cladophorae]